MAARIERDKLLGARGPMDPDGAERQQVEQWRRTRASWAAIARNLGRSEPDVRRAYDPEFKRQG